MNILGKSVFSTLAATSLLLLTSSAHATLMMQLSDNSGFLNDATNTTVTATDTDGDGVVNVTSIFDGIFADWNINVTTGVSSPAIGNEELEAMDLNSINVSGGTGTMYIRLTDTDFKRHKDSYVALVGGTTDGSACFQSYSDSTNSAFGMENLLSDYCFASDASDAFSNGDDGYVDYAADYSVSIYAMISHTGAGQSTSFDYNVQVPEPAPLALLGFGLLAMTFVSRRKKQ